MNDHEAGALSMSEQGPMSARADNPRKPIRWTTVASWAAIFLVLATLGWGLINATATRPEAGQPAPDFSARFFDGYEWEARPVAALSEMRGRPVVLNFWASWCGPCKSFAPVFEAASEQHPDIVFGKVDADSEQELAATFSIRSIPFVMLFREKVVLFAQAGALPAEGLESIIRQARALDMAQVHKEIAEQQAQQQQ